MNTSFTDSSGIGFGRPPVTIDRPGVLRSVISLVVPSTHSVSTPAPSRIAAKRRGKQSLGDLSELAAIAAVLCLTGLASIWATTM